MCSALLAGGCSGSPAAGGRSEIRLYTSVTQETVDGVVSAFHREEPGVKVDVFRAPTGQLNARIAAEERAGGTAADLIWATDPLSMHGWDAQHLLASGWTPNDAGGIPARYRTSTFWGTRLLYMVIVYRKGLDRAPASWRDLADPAYRDAVEIPDPGFAGSAFATLGYLWQAPGFGMDFYRRLKANGARQVQSPDDVVTDVAEGRADAGITLEFSARQAVESGSPVAVVWPEPGAISLYSPVAVTAHAANPSDARVFVQFLLGTKGQRVIAASGWQPAAPGVPGPAKSPGAKVVDPDWASLFDQQSHLLEAYRSIFPG